MRRVSSMYRNQDDTMRARVYDRRDIGARCAKGTQFAADIFVREERSLVNIGGRKEVTFGVKNSTEELGDTFGNKYVALEWIVSVFLDYDKVRGMYAPRQQIAFAMKTPPDTYIQGWDDHPEVTSACPGHYRDNQGWCHECGLYLGMNG